MNTPVWDFVKKYAESGYERMHVPGHKGMAGPLGVEPYDITEVKGADELYAPKGIIEESEQNASSIFGSGRTVYGTEGSSQCIKAMLYLAISNRCPGSLPLIVAARNVHSAFVHAAALLDFDVEWIMSDPDTEWYLPDFRYSGDIESCPVTMYGLLKKLEKYRDTPPAAVYLTSPDYLGVHQDIGKLAKFCHSREVPLLVDDAQGAYLKFMGVHPMDLGADMCCDSAHKTLPVLTGGAYLHISKAADKAFVENAKKAMALFGSTSPSYLTLSSLDLCNKYMSEDLPEKISHTASLAEELKKELTLRGFDVAESDPLRIVIRGDGEEISGRLREAGIEPEYVSRDAVVLMVTPYNSENFSSLVLNALPKGKHEDKKEIHLFSHAPTRVMSIRQALFSPGESIPVTDALGRVCNSFLSKCPPGVPIVMPGERIDETALRLLQYYGYKDIDVVC